MASPALIRQLSEDGIRELIIIHLSDIHYGPTHTFDPPAAAAGDVPDGRDYPTLLQKLAADLDEEDPGCPVLVALTGDMAQSGTFQELKKAEDFVTGLSEIPLLGKRHPVEDVFIVPGNHDVVFDKADIGERWQQWTEFHNRLRGTRVDRNEPWDLDAVDDRVDDLGAIIVTINSATKVQKGMPDQDRGLVEAKQIDVLEKRLEAVDPQRLKSAIRVALIHHHPVLLPDLVEPGRGYDAVVNSAKLLSTLRRFGFHVLLHGHKHNPHVFTEDGFSAYRRGEPHPILIAAGGSVGSTELPTKPPCGNCYNRIVVKWNANADQTRIRVTTRGLRVMDDAGEDLLPWSWDWQTMRIDDRQFIGGHGAPAPRAPHERKYNRQDDAAADGVRIAEYQKFHGYFPVAAVMPSLEADQVNEARLWVVRHPPPRDTEPGPAIESVTWSAGVRFPIVTVDASDDPNLCAVLHYYGPMLVQARMKFEDDQTVDAHVYVRLPQALDRPEG